MTITDRMTGIPGQALLLETLEEGGQLLRVFEHEGLRYLYWGDNALQSVMEVRTPARVTSPVAAVMLTALRFSPPVVKVLNLGVGGGTFERYFAATDTPIELVSVEKHAAVIGLARQYFHLEDTPVIQANAEDYLRDSQEHFDLILCDLFESQRPADCLASSQFMARIANAVSPERGTAVFNLVSGDQQNLLNTLKRIREHLPWTRLATVGDRGNLVVFCRHSRPMASDDQLEQSARTLLATDAFAPLPFAFNLLEVPDREDQNGPPGRERR